MKILAARRQDVNEGFVWLNRPGFPSRCIVRIKNPGNSKSVYCEALQIDDNFRNEYNDDTRRFQLDLTHDPIVISGWFRARLGDLERQKDYALEIAPCNGLWGKLRACMHHPQVVVRVGAWLGVISVGLGLVGIILGLLSIWLS